MRVTSRAFATFSHDVVMAALSFLLSFYLRVGGEIFNYPPLLLGTYDLAFAATAAVIFRWSGLYRGIWRFASLPDLLALLRAVTLIILIFFPVMFVATRLEGMPRSVVGINWLLLTAMLGAPRFAYRVLKDRGLDHDFATASSRARSPRMARRGWSYSTTANTRSIRSIRRSESASPPSRARRSSPMCASAGAWRK
jgi:FlaA1/EpsC-like NDP-sugar epimerase